MGRKWFYIVSFSYIVDFLLLPCTYIAFALDNYSVLSKCGAKAPKPSIASENSEASEHYIKVGEISVGAGLLIIIAGLVHRSHFNKMKWPAYFILILDICLLIAFIIGASWPWESNDLNFDISCFEDFFGDNLNNGKMS